MIFWVVVKKMIRKANYKNDLKHLHELITAAYQLEMGSEGLSFRALPRWSNNIADESIKQDIGRMYVYEEDNKIIGCIGVKVENDIAIIGPLAVSLNHRKQGIGTKLLDFAESLAPTAEVHRISCRTDLVDFYEKQGYMETTFLEDITESLPRKEISKNDITCIVYFKKKYV